MKRLWALTLLLLAATLILACGNSSNRQLQSISISSTANGGQVQLLATGHFSSPPSTVTPLPVFWALDLPPSQYTLTTRPFVIQCSSGGSLGPFFAMAPVNPMAPSTGSIASTTMISQSTSCADVGQ